MSFESLELKAYSFLTYLIYPLGKLLGAITGAHLLVARSGSMWRGIQMTKQPS